MQSHSIDPKQFYLFNEWNFDDMEADDYEEAYFSYLLDHIEEAYDNDYEF